MILRSNYKISKEKVYINGRDASNIQADDVIEPTIILSVFSCETLTPFEIDYIIDFLKNCKDTQRVPLKYVDVEREVARRLKFQNVTEPKKETQDEEDKNDYVLTNGLDT